MKHSDQIDKISEALVVCQGKVQNNSNDIRTAMLESGLALTFNTKNTKKGIILKPTLIHSSGQYFEYDAFTVPVNEETATAQEQAIQHGRRHLSHSIIGAPATSVPQKRTESKGAQKPNKASMTPEETAKNNMYLETRASVVEFITKTVGVKGTGWTEEQRNAIELTTLMNNAKTTRDVNLLFVAQMRVRESQRYLNTPDWFPAVQFILGCGIDLDKIMKVSEFIDHKHSPATQNDINQGEFA